MTIRRRRRDKRKGQGKKIDGEREEEKRAGECTEEIEREIE